MNKYLYLNIRIYIFEKVFPEQILPKYIYLWHSIKMLFNSIIKQANHIILGRVNLPRKKKSISFDRYLCMKLFCTIFKRSRSFYWPHINWENVYVLWRVIMIYEADFVISVRLIYCRQSHNRLICGHTERTGLIR